MKVLRKQELKTSNIQVRDQIVINLKGFGEFTATVQKITDRGILFLFDDCVVRQPMNTTWTNKGGYEKSDMCKWIRNVLSEAFPEYLKDRIENLTIPTYGQLFGHDDWYNNVIEPDNDEQLPLMVKRKNRIADFDNNYKWYWLQNATKKEISSSHFAGVSNLGNALYDGASGSRGVRPIFWLVD